MVNLAIVYPLLLVILTAIAIYVQVTSSTLSLPLSTGTTVLTIILPLLAAANVFYTPYLSSFLRQKLTSSSALQQLLPVALQVLQGILTVVLATLSAEGFIPGQLLDCSLHGNWQRMYREHDGRSIERIQDSFTCCGLRTVKDMDWPRLQCSALYGDRHDACIGPWRAAMQRSAGLEFAVAVTVGILQLIQLSFFGLRNSGGSGARTGYRRIVQSVGGNPHERLLENGRANGDDEGDTPEIEDNTGNDRRGYGTLGDGPNHRIEPSNLGDDGNHWRESS